MKIFYGKIICSTHQKKCSLTILGNFAKKLFFGKIIYSSHQKKCFSTILGNCWKIEFWTKIRQARALTKIVKILYYLKMCKEIIFGKIIYSTHQKKLFSQL